MFRPDLETLEDRRTPAVTASIVNGNLILTGDAADDLFSIDPISPGIYVINGLGTTINGSPSLTTSSLPGRVVTGDLRINIGGGNDRVNIGALVVPRDLLFQGGADGNFLSMSGTNIGRHLTVTGSNGSDLAGLSFGAVGGNVTFKLGNGHNNPGILASSIGGNVSFVGGADTDIFSLNITDDNTFVDIGGNVQVNLGNGSNSVLLAASDGSGGVNGLLTIGGSLTITGGVATDSVGVQALQNGSKINIGGNVTINLNGGDNSTALTINAAESAWNVGGSLKLSGKGGIDALSTGGSINLLTVGKNLSANLGNGNNTFELRGQTLVGRNLSIQGGTSEDHVLVTSTAAPPRILGKTSVSLGNGTGSVDLQGFYSGAVAVVTGSDGDTIDLESATFLGAVSLSSGNGDDFVNIDNAVFHSVFKLLAGGGLDDLKFEQETALDGDTTFVGKVSVKAGSGNDILFFGSATDQIFLESATVLDGGPGSNTLNLGNFTENGPPLSTPNWLP